MFRTSLPTLRFQPDLDPLEAWRSAEALVRARWDEYRAARREDRRGAFAAYTAALDAEAAAARELRPSGLAAAA
jgi:hypothetical protein